ncbi:DUF4974 domain-containing protein [Thalassoroseus pseudoceratinae]|uniref:DUF4974 domain-containing protein n=1 Tax=Thalassoroseus pseudoceratinae TaxID=2713176 RepID=UPI00141D7CB5|nr:DUF4974 domain-containing protein [Thalassoroseus pseudoceratinae]
MKLLRLLIMVSVFSFLTSSLGTAAEKDAPAPMFGVRDSTKTEQKIRTKLREIFPGPVVFQDNNVRELLQYLADVSDIKIYPESLDEFENDIDGTRITLEMGEGRLEDVLRILCKTVSVDFIVEDSFLKIVPEQVAATRFETVVYDLKAFADLGYPIDDMSSVLRKTVAPGSWALHGSTDMPGQRANFVANHRSPTQAATKSRELQLSKGAIEPVPGGVIVYQSKPIHREIEQTLQQLWKLAKRRQDAKATEAAPVTARDPKQDS